MADVVKLLETMHPMREPAAPAAVAPYLVMLGFGCAAALALFVIVWQMRRRRAALRAAAEAALVASRRLAPGDRLAAQAVLLRRLVRSLAGDEAAGVRGEAWLARLDQVFATSFFTKGAGTAFGDDLYRRVAAPGMTQDLDAVDHALAGFIGRMRPRARG